MMTKKRVLSGMPAVLLAFAVLFSACENGTTDVEGTVGISGQEAPKVTAEPVKGGVLLAWPPVADLSASYTVWRKTVDADPVRIDNRSSLSISQDPETGKYRYLDLVSNDNELIAGTEYTYTVTASGSSKTAAQTVVKATPAVIPPKGTKFDPVTGVTLALDQAAETMTVSWVEPTGGIPGQYNVQVYRGGTDLTASGGSITAFFGQTSKTFNWPSSSGPSQADGVYTALVTVQAFSGGSSAYYKTSNAAVSPEKPFESLFALNSGGYSFFLPSVSGSPAPAFLNAAGDTIAGFYATLYFSSFKGKPGVTYAVERAPLDAAGNAGTYVAATLSSTDTTRTDLPAGALTADVLGNVPVTGTVYDRGIPAAGGKFYYRIKAEKGSVTQTKDLNGGGGSPTTVRADLYTALIDHTTIAIAAATGADTKTYQVTPTLPKGGLQAGDKLVFYYAKGAAASYTAGPYVKGPEFTKDQLEAAAVAAKPLAIPKAAGDDYAFVRAYIEQAASGQRNNVSAGIRGGGVSSVESGYSTDDNYATLNY